MKVNGKLKRIRAFERRQFNKWGLSIIFETELGELARTFNIPQNCYNIKSELNNVLKKSFGIIPGAALYKIPILLAQHLQQKNQDKIFELVIEETQKKDFPFNIVQINPTDYGNIK